MPVADLSDVENALVTQIAIALFPGATLNGSYAVSNASWAAPATAANPTPAPAAGTCKLYRGWPESANLNADLVAGRAHVSVYPEPGMGRNTTRYQSRWHTNGCSAPTFAATTEGATITFGQPTELTDEAGNVLTDQTGAPLVSFGDPNGILGAGQVVGVAVGVGPDYATGNGLSPAAYAYRVLSTDTPTTVAAALAALIPGATSAGNVLTLPTLLYSARVVADQAAWLETRRQIRFIRVDCWCPSPMARDAVASLVDGALAQVHWLPLSDGSSGRLLFAGDGVDDKPSKDRLWRRWLRYSIEYATTLLETQPECLFVGMEVTNAHGA